MLAIHIIYIYIYICILICVDLSDGFVWFCKIFIIMCCMESYILIQCNIMIHVCYIMIESLLIHCGSSSALSHLTHSALALQVTKRHLRRIVKYISSPGLCWVYCKPFWCCSPAQLLNTEEAQSTSQSPLAPSCCCTLCCVAFFFSLMSCPALNILSIYWTGI